MASLSGMVNLTSCGTLVILITSIGEFLLYYCQFFYYFHSTVKKKKKKIPTGRFLVLSCVALFLLHDCMSSGFEL